MKAHRPLTVLWITLASIAAVGILMAIRLSFTGASTDQVQGAASTEQTTSKPSPTREPGDRVTRTVNIESQILEPAPEDVKPRMTPSQVRESLVGTVDLPIVEDGYKQTADIRFGTFTSTMVHPPGMELTKAPVWVLAFYDVPAVYSRPAADPGKLHEGNEGREPALPDQLGQSEHQSDIFYFVSDQTGQLLFSFTFGASSENALS